MEPSTPAALSDTITDSFETPVNGMVRDCQECVRLWTEYRTTIAAHVKLAAALRFALQDKLPVIESLKLELEALDEIRTVMRDAIWRHRGTHVGTAPGG